MSLSMVLVVAGIALGAGGYYFAKPALSGWGFAAAVAALMVWLARNAWEQRSAKRDSAAAADLGEGFGPAPGSHHDAGGATPDGGGSDSGGNS